MLILLLAFDLIEVVAGLSKHMEADESDFLEAIILVGPGNNRSHIDKSVRFDLL